MHFASSESPDRGTKSSAAGLNILPMNKAKTDEKSFAYLECKAILECITSFQWSDFFRQIIAYPVCVNL